MRFIAWWILIWTAADARALWLLGVIRKRGLWAMAAFWAFAELLALPHVIWGWQVHQHLAIGTLRLLTNALALVIPILLGSTLIAGGWLAARRLHQFFPRVFPTPVDPRKRRFLRAALLQAPLAGVAAAAPAGVASSWTPAQKRTVRIALPALPAGLEGMKILQISDLHLGPVLDLPWLERALRDLPSDIDLVAITGDLSDDLRLLPQALERICAVPSRLGYFIIPGNHEHYVGIDDFHRRLEGSPVQLITNRAVQLSRNQSPFTLAGIDYPYRRRIKQDEQFAEMLDQTLPQVPAGQFHIVLSHHPDAFEIGADRQVPLMLSGHTHGGQVSIGGVALVDLVVRYSRGLYEKGASRLFVTTGLGHWFPFRLDCPTELPLIELTRSESATR